MRFDAARAGVVPVTNAKIAALLLPWLRSMVRTFPRAAGSSGLRGFGNTPAAREIRQTPAENNKRYTGLRPTVLAPYSTV